MNNDVFSGIATKTVTTALGPVELPILYYDFSSVIFMFFLKHSLVEPLLKGTGLRPCIFAGRRAMAIVVFFEYRNSSIGRYNEVGLCTATYSTNKRKPLLFLPNLIKKGENWNIGAYVHNLPVTTDLANTAGRTIWGYPKFVTEIDFRLSQNSFAGTVFAPDSTEPILSMSGKMGKIGTSPLLPSIDIVTHTIKDGSQIQTSIRTDGKAKYNFLPSIRLDVGDNEHPMTQNLKKLHLHQKRPFAMATSFLSRSMLPEGHIIGPTAHR